MDLASRIALMVLLGLACALQAPAEAGDDPPHRQIDRPSIAACGGCHQRVFEEWADSLHARAWTNDNVRQATNDFSKKSCRPCHSPQPALFTGLQKAPDYRPFNQPDGVHCLSCHGLEDGVAAARDIPAAPCRPRRDPRIQRADFCYPCHQPTHQAFDEYARSSARTQGIRCVDCHMPVRPDGSGRSHGPHGGLQADFVRRALSVRLGRTGNELELELRNRTGHKFPGEIPSRSCVVRVSFAGPGSAPIASHERSLRKPHRGEDRPDNRLQPDETRRVRYAWPAAAERAEVEVRFQPFPLMAPEDGFLLFRWTGGRDELSTLGSPR